MNKCTWLAVLCLSMAGFVGSSVKAQAEVTMTCPTGTYDMLDWMMMDSSLRPNYHMEGTANPLYTSLGGGKFYWTKGEYGTPWDIQLFDSKYIYLWITESDWNNPHTFKKFAQNTNMPLAPRCAKGGFPGSTITVDDTSYQTYTDCTHYTTHTLLKGVNQMWGPYKVSFGGDLPSNLPVLVTSYRYNCNDNYGNCGDKEEYYFAQKYGLVQWVHYSLKSGIYKPTQSTIFNRIVKGTASPSFSCF
jgi:hypothetical protein